MSSTNTDKVHKSINRVLFTPKGLKVDLPNVRRRYPFEDSIKGISEAPFNEISYYVIACSEEGLKCERIRRYSQGRNESYAEALISRYFEKPKVTNQPRKLFLPKEVANRTRYYEVAEYSLNTVETIQKLREKALFKILQDNSCDVLKKLDLRQFSKEKARLIHLIIQLCELLDNSMEYVRIWLDSPHPSLGNRKPISYLLEGKPDAIEILIYAVETGQPI